MPNVFLYSAGTTPSTCLRKGNLLIGNNTGDYGATFYNGITPPASGYTIYIDKASNGPSIYCPADTADLLNITREISGVRYNTVAECLNYFATQSDKVIVNRDYEKIVTSGLTLNLDAGFTPSYPTTGTTWYDISLSGNNGTFINGPIFNSNNGGSIVFDGVDDYVNFGSSPTITNQFTNEIWVNITAVNGIQYIFGKESAYRVIAFYNYPGVPDQLTWVCATTNNSWYSAGTAIDYPTTITGWKQIVGVYDGTKNLLYVNGALVITGSAISGNVANGVGNLTLMSNNGVGLLYGKGNVSSFKQYNRALSATEILQNYNATKSRFGL